MVGVVSDQLSVVSDEEQEPKERTQEDKWRAHIGRRIAAEFLELEKLRADLADKESELDDVKADVAWELIDPETPE